MTTPSKRREINSLATNTPHLKDWGKTGVHENGNTKQGYFRLDDNRVIKLSDLSPTTLKIGAAIDDVEAQAERHPELYNCKNLAFDKVVHGNTGATSKVLKPGFYQLLSGKVISLKKLAEAIEVENQRNNKTVQEN